MGVVSGDAVIVGDRWRSRFSYRGLVALVASALLITTGIFAIEILGYRANPLIVRAKISESITDATSAFPAEWAQNTVTGVDTFTDCIALQVATHIPDTIKEALVSAPYEIGPVDHVCAGVLERLGPFQAGANVTDYWRYWWGAASLLAAVLDVDGTTLPEYQAALKYGTYLVLGMIAIVSMVRFKVSGLLVLPVILSLVFGYGIPLFGQSVAHAPGLLAGLIILLGYVIASPLHTRRWSTVAVASVAGGVTFYFDLLNGNLIAVLLLLAVLNLASVRQQSANATWPISASTLAVILGYVSGAAYVLMLRCVLRSVVMKQQLGSVVSEWLHALSMRTRNAVPDYGDSEIGPIYVVKRLYYKLDYAFVPYLSQREATLVYLAGRSLFGFCFLWIALKFHKRSYLPKDAVAATLVIASIVPLWYLVLANHTAVHSWMTGRLLSPFFALGISLTILLGATTDQPSRRLERRAPQGWLWSLVRRPGPDCL